MMRYGVQGSALPGFKTRGMRSANEGIHNECTPGELFGNTAPNDCVRGKKLNEFPSRTPKPRSSISQSICRVRPLSTLSMFASMLLIFDILRRARTYGIPVVADTWAT